MGAVWIGLVILAATGLDALLILRRRRGKQTKVSASPPQDPSFRQSWARSFLQQHLPHVSAGLTPAITGLLLIVLTLFAVRGTAFYWWPLEVSLVLGLALIGYGGVRVRLVALGKLPSRRAEPRRGETHVAIVELDRPDSQAELAMMLVGGCALLLIGQSVREVLSVDQTYTSAAFTISGLLLVTLGIWGLRSTRLAAMARAALRWPAQWLRVSRLQLVALALSPLLAWGVWLTAGDGERMRLPYLAVGLWIGAIGLLVLSGWPKGGLVFRAMPKAEAIAVAGIVLAGLLLRGVRTDQIPWLLTGDEASGGLSAAEFLDGKRDNPFTVGWFSFPSLYFFIQSLSIRLFGRTIQALRLTSALAGALTVGVLYEFAREAFGRRVAVAAALYLAAFHFHIHFSRLGLNNVWDGLFATAFTLAFWRGWTSESRLSFMLAGIGLGLAQYFYASVRVLLALLPIWLLAVAIRDRGSVRRRLPHLVALAVAALVVALPLFLYYFKHPSAYIAPMARVSVFGRWPAGADWWRVEGLWPYLASQFKTSALAFTGTNLKFWYQPGHPMLLPLAAALFLVGLVVVLLDLLKPAHLWVVLWLLGAVAIGALSESTPAAQRYVFVAPAVAVVIALALERGVSSLSQVWPSRAPLILVGGTGILMLACWQDFSFYFNDFSARHRFGDVNTEVATVLGGFLAETEPGTRVYFLGGRMRYFSHSTIRYLAPAAVGQDVMETLTDPPEWAIPWRDHHIPAWERRPVVHRICPGQPLSPPNGRYARLEELRAPVGDLTSCLPACGKTELQPIQ